MFFNYDIDKVELFAVVYKVGIEARSLLESDWGSLYLNLGCLSEILPNGKWSSDTEFVVQTTSFRKARWCADFSDMLVMCTQFNGPKHSLVCFHLTFRASIQAKLVSYLCEAAFWGGVMGMGMGTAFRGVQTLSKALTTRYAAACVPVTIGQKLGLAYLSGKGIAHGVEAIGNGEMVEGVSSVLFGALGVAGALSMRWNCFTAGHQILALPLGATVAEPRSARVMKRAAGERSISSAPAWRLRLAWPVGRTNAANAGDCWRKPATMCMVASGNQTRDMNSTMTMARCGKQSPWTTTRSRLFGRMNRSCQTRIHSMSRRLLLVASDAEQTHGVACLPPPQAAQFDSNAARHKTIRCPQSERESQAAERISSRRPLARSFTRRRFLLPVPGATSLVAHRWPVIRGTQHSIASASLDTNVGGDYRVGGESYKFFNIEDIRPGQLVLASNPATGQLEPRRVLQTFRRTTYHLRHLTFQSPSGARQTFETTDEHPFWSHGAARWTPAGDLQPGDRVIDPHGAQSLLVATHREPHPEGVTVYNFEVEGFHSYFVAGKGPSGQPVLVHNAGCGPNSPSRSRSRPSTPEYRSNFDRIFAGAPNSGKPPIQGPIRPYNQAKKAKTPGYDDHHLDPPLGRFDPSYPQGPTIRVRNDNAGGKVPGGVNLHTAKGGFQTALRQHITKDLGFTVREWNKLPDSVRKLHLARYYASLGIPFPN